MSDYPWSKNHFGVRDDLGLIEDNIGGDMIGGVVVLVDLTDGPAARPHIPEVGSVQIDEKSIKSG